jgi:uncharacterized hydantoinase/oxoprolinase family protein
VRLADSYETRAQALLDIIDRIEKYYNRQRLYSSAEYHTSVPADELLLAACAAVSENGARSN